MQVTGGHCETEGEETKVQMGASNPWERPIQLPEVLLFQENGKIVGAGSVEENNQGLLTVRELRPVIPPFPYDLPGAFSVLEARESDTVKHDTARYPCKDGSTTRP